jgi:hypothetical protein
MPRHAENLKNQNRQPKIVMIGGPDDTLEGSSSLQFGGQVCINTNLA